MTGISSATWSQMPPKLRLLSCHGNWEIVVLSFSIITFQTHGSQVLEDMFLGCKTGKLLI